MCWYTGTHASPHSHCVHVIEPLRLRASERCASSASSSLYERPPTLRTLVVRHFLHKAIGVSHNSFSDGVDPILLLFLGVCDEVHRITLCRELECIRFVDDIFCALHREALVDRDASSRLGLPPHLGAPACLRLLSHLHNERLEVSSCLRLGRKW